MLNVLGHREGKLEGKLGRCSFYTDWDEITDSSPSATRRVAELVEVGSG